MIITEKKEIVGRLLTQGQVFEMLDLYQRIGRDLPFLLRENSFQFYVVVYGFAQYIVVARGSFAIIPYSSPEVQAVRFIVEGDEKVEEKIEVEFIPQARIDLASLYHTN